MTAAADFCESHWKTAAGLRNLPGCFKGALSIMSAFYHERYLLVANCAAA